ncbi:hypothetical protein L596_015847 [Steinernema carpocapsae]|uniref:Rap-GAP domain-containing protein n=1 Tax=Steinernema carpocapsae TaxID=34508 RepID=A0A4U5NHF2_STECR|nr:hypothetical protein L596_015847 [Steinernema carpocapsae]
MSKHACFRRFLSTRADRNVREDVAHVRTPESRRSSHASTSGALGEQAEAFFGRREVEGVLGSSTKALHNLDDSSVVLSGRKRRAEHRNAAPGEVQNIGTPLPARSESDENTELEQPVIEYVQIIVRHIHGKQTYVMRTFENLPADFHQLNLPSTNAHSLLQHLTLNSNALQIAPSLREQAARNLRNLDRVPDKEYHAVGVIYVGEGQTYEQEILANRFGSVRYVQFLRLLGKVIPLDKCPGGLTPKDGGHFTYENSDAITQTVFLVATLMPTNEHDPQCNNKKRVINNNFVSIVFNESRRPYKLGTVCGQFGHVALEVVPHDESTVLIRVIARPEIACCMAMSRAYLPDKDAVQLLRKMVIRAQLSVNVWHSQKESGGGARRSSATPSTDSARSARSARRANA